ncbi:uncharacterized protein LOC131642754 [Vicia villosa]|uniref:uncharacterized protein LOC131642754 n=1 Tax=Vicia villosa TaxID=3911 RepID=UPI00273C7CA4|nr:uncharacterized protein LOC131642754 [Vicia villosa]
MSQSSPSKKSSPSSETASGSRAPNVVSDQDVVLNVVPLNSVPATDPVRREGSAYVHNAIAGIVTRILNEGHQVDGISVPLAQIPASENSKDDQDGQDDASKDQGDVETSVDNNDEKTPGAKDVETSEAINVETSGTKDAEILEPEKAEKVPVAPSKETLNEGPTVHDVVNLDDLDDSIDIADDELISSISHRVKTRKGKQVCDQDFSKPQATPQVTPQKKVTIKKIKKVPAEPSTTGSKTAVKKRKERSVSAPEDDVLSDFVYQRRLALERELANDAQECQEVMKLIKSAGLIKTVTHFSKCYEMLVKEFIVNLSQDCCDGRTDDFHKVYVRRKCIDFSPAVINLYLGRDAEAQPELEVTDNEVCKVITGGKVKKWPIKSKLSASSLNVRYALLHKIGAANWVPTNHTSTIAVGLGRFIYAVGTKTKFDYGTYIFDQTMRHVGTSATKLPIAFPSLICGIILKKHPGILKSKDSVCKRESALSFHYKLLQRSDDMTSAGTSQPSKSVNKALLIAELKETCQELDNRKLKLEKLIQSLEQSTDDDLAGERDGDNMDEDKGAEEEAEEEAEDAEAEGAESGSSDAAAETSSSSDDNPGGSSDEDSDGSDD